ncbi:AraC-like DNA-binding protein [Pseudochelatococcus lubricantis]|uniref:AraC-like DNA-binding protein n=1 Tax=Pseudochelatococcus lubricantis TaxID=1538102 RepID=A0ABX0UZD7_9HYPH|nr:AraC-like DNA-binding protein [Pseudochelatococcus lubricantis]
MRLLNDMPDGEFNEGTFELRLPGPGRADDRARALARLVASGVDKDDPAGEACADSFIAVFSVHLLRKHPSVKDPGPSQFSGGLSPGTWRRVNDFIHGHLGEALSLQRMAAVARLSSSHFARAFRESTGNSPHRYVVACRLARARKLIIDTFMPLAEVAKACGFSSNSHLTATMRQAWGVTPTDLRRQR